MGLFYFFYFLNYNREDGGEPTHMTSLIFLGYFVCLLLGKQERESEKEREAYILIPSV